MSILAFGLGNSGSGSGGIGTRFAQIKDAELQPIVLDAELVIPELNIVEIQTEVLSAAVVVPKLDAEIFDEC